MADKLKILIVDDDDAQLFLLHRLLKYSLVDDVVVARTIEEAKRALDQQTIDGAVLDLVLDTGSGLEVAKVCAEHGVPVVFNTGTGDEYNTNLMYEFGWVVTKPTRANIIGRAVEYFRTHKKAKGAA